MPPLSPHRPPYPPGLTFGRRHWNREMQNAMPMSRWFVRFCAVQEVSIRFLEDSTRVSCYTWADEERGELRVYIRRRDESVLGHLMHRQVRFIMELPPFLLDFDIEAVLWQSQLSDMRVVITDLGGSIEVAADNVEAFNSFVLRAHESIEATFGAGILTAGVEVSLEVVTTTRSGVPVTPFKRQAANTALEVLRPCGLCCARVPRSTGLWPMAAGAYFPAVLRCVF
jgi:hypothetical protein